MLFAGSHIKLRQSAFIAHPLTPRLTRSIMASRFQIKSPPHPLVPPAFYTSKQPPPHHTANGFVSPWASAGKNGFLKFIRARIFDWQESPLPDAGALPAVRPCSWLPQGSTAENVKDQILFSWLGHAACHWSIPVPASSTSDSLQSSSSTSASASEKPIVILTDPVFSKRCSPFQWLGPQRYTATPTNVEDMANSSVENVWPDLLVLSHNHYDHLDHDTVKEILSEPNGRPRPHIFCPLGLAVWFRTNMGVPEDGVTELDWWQERMVVLDDNRKIKLTCVPAQHFSGRSFTDRDQTLWAGWTFETLPTDDASTVRGKKIYFAGDTGYRTVPYRYTKEQEETLETCPAFKEIGELLGPFDHAAIPIGAYEPRSVMSAIHVSFVEVF
jgi:N-acyl-phosphatidylethanolamine-hydrolysing phospholipase D